MKITKEKWNSKAYRWISVIMVLLLVLAPVGIFGVKVSVKADDASYTGSSFTLVTGDNGYKLQMFRGEAANEVTLDSSASGTITLSAPEGGATFTVSAANANLPNLNIICNEGVSVTFDSAADLTLNSFTVKDSINLGNSGILRVYSATLNNTSAGVINVFSSQANRGSVKLTGNNTDVTVSVSDKYTQVSSEGSFMLDIDNVGYPVTGPANGYAGELAGLFPTIDDISGETFYVGGTYDMNEYTHYPAGYTSDQFTFRYLLSSSVIGVEMPTVPGTYEVLVTGPTDAGTSSPRTFTISYFPGVDLDISEVDEEGKVTVSAPAGYKISLDNEIYDSYIKFSEEQLYPEEGMFDETLQFYVRVTDGVHEGARSEALSYSDVAPGLAKVNFHPEEVIPHNDDEEEIIPDDEEEVVPDEEEEVVPEEEEKEEEPKEEEKKEEFKPADESGHSGKTDNTSNTTTVSKPSPNITLTLDDQIYGLTYAPSFKSDSTGSVKYLYSKAGENKFSEAKPTEPGKYVCRALQEGTDKFGQGTKDVNFSILYLAAPSDAYSISGKKGNNGYYVSDVYLTAPDGYSISLTLNGTYEDKVQVSSEKTKYIYLKRKSDGAMTDGIGIKEGIKVDAKAPVVSGKATDVDGNEVALGGKIYSDKVSFKMADEHLSKVTVNGEEVTVTDGAADISLDANNRHMVYKISAEDEAGNIFTFTVNVYAPWMESGVIPAGVKVGLEAGSKYKLEDGEWATDVDSTVYTGGMDFYVAEDMELTFIKVK